MLAGNVVALLSPLVFVPVLTYAFGPQNYDYKSMAAIRLGDDTEIALDAHTDLESIPGTQTIIDTQQTEKEQAKLRRASRIAKSLTVFLTVALLVLWPMPMYGSSYVFSKKFFTGWVVVGILWIFCSLFCVGLYPLFEGRHSLLRVSRGITADLKGRRGRVVRGEGSDKASSVGAGREGVSEKMDEKQASAVVGEKK